MRSGRVKYTRSSSRGGARRDRRNLRTISDADWILEPHSPWTRRNAARLRPLQDHAEPATKFVVLDLKSAILLTVKLLFRRTISSSWVSPIAAIYDRSCYGPIPPRASRSQKIRLSAECQCSYGSRLVIRTNGNGSVPSC